MNKKITLFPLFICFLSLFSFGQQMPLDFEDSSQNFSTFNGTSFTIVANPEDNTDQVGQITNDGSQPYQGISLNLQRPIDLSQNQQIVLDFYSLDANAHSILLKLEDGSDTDVEVRVEVNAGSGNQWINDLVFDFSNAFISTTSNIINATGTYNRIVVFVDGGETRAGTYLIDDIDDGSDPIDLHALDVEYTQLVWADEFDGSTLDTDKWYHQTFGPNGGQWFNGEAQHYTDRPENSYVADGFLHIVAKKETFSQDNVTLDYTSARLNSKYAFTYGRVDIRAKLPEGQGTWPALWTLGKNITEAGAYWETQGFGTTPWPDCGEIDIMEHGLHGLDEVSSALHTRSSYGATVNTETKQLTNVADNFHVYSVNWSPEQITFLIDGVGYYTYRKPDTPLDDNNDGIDDAWPFDADQFLLLNVAMGGVAGAIDQNFTESAMVVDWVRVYQGANLSTDDVFSSKFSLYPNPARDLIRIKTNEEISGIQVLSTLGQVVIEQTENTNRIDVQDLASGIYILRISANNRIATKKVIIQN